MKPIEDAARGLTPQPLTDELMLDLSEADAEENVARDSWELKRGRVERVTLIRKLRKQAALSNACADSLEELHDE